MGPWPESVTLAHHMVRVDLRPSVRPPVRPSVRPSARPSVSPSGRWAHWAHLGQLGPFGHVRGASNMIVDPWTCPRS